MTGEGEGVLALPVIGLWQPYATLVAVGAKPWETRHFPLPARLRGRRVAIQATLRRPTREEVHHLLPQQIARTLGAGWEQRVPYGAVVCTAVLCASYVVRDHHDDGMVTLGAALGPSFRDDGFGDYSIGRWCWELRDVEHLAVPIPLRGRQDVGWPWLPDVDQRNALRARAAP